MGLIISSREHAEIKRLRRRAYWKQNGLCYWCQREMTMDGNPGTDPLALTADHLTPFYAGGKTRPGNIVAACYECNNKRNPEANRGHGGISVGNDRPISPFAALAALFCEAAK